MPRMHEVPARLKTPLGIALDAALPECKWKRIFNLAWRDHGIDAAYQAWRRGPIVNECFIPQVEQAIEDIKQWPLDT